MHNFLPPTCLILPPPNPNLMPTYLYTAGLKPHRLQPCTTGLGLKGKWRQRNVAPAPYFPIKHPQTSIIGLKLQKLKFTTEVVFEGLGEPKTSLVAKH